MSLNGARRYRIEHHTAYRYSEPVMLSHQQLHLTARLLESQKVHAHEIAIAPKPGGRDFSDVTPLRGVISGGGVQKLEVKVTMEPISGPAGDELVN
jgi:hypothetical protein